MKKILNVGVDRYLLKDDVDILVLLGCLEGLVEVKNDYHGETRIGATVAQQPVEYGISCRADEQVLTIAQWDAMVKDALERR